MGSLRNPIGPLPSSIYWRRRAVLLSMVAVLALLAVWAVTGGGGSGAGGSGTPDGKGPAPSITPGPSGSGPAISEQPGGRDESGESGGSGGGSGSGSGSGSGAGGDSGGAGGATGDVGENGVADGSGTRVPAGAALANCTPAQVMWTLRSVRNEYEPGEKPKFELIAENTSASHCKVDVGPEGTILTITQADGGDVLWASDDCPVGPAHVFLKVAQGGKFTHAVEWDRKPSEKECATPRPGSAEPGTYLVEAKTPGLPTARASFVLKEA
ncbi:hypothetical protein RCO28_35630 [Streptomyces sp. LHD-70]|uniref:hypothetical protein n=1 Tax=Streptomyces sp. LHD-70 TaxID=3072140 RepID=UPI00280E7140|nr:hypothetical protein [Streptomyces sp. LHD-70]MDQ8707765.1 hypothetical protein [Streptomyces sp. LHD-70]